MTRLPGYPRAVMIALLGASAMLILLGVWVRGHDVRSRGGEPVAVSEPSIPEPMQLLARGAEHRIDQRWQWIAEDHRTAWDKVWATPFQIQGCPQLAEWITTPRGQQLEQLIGVLERGTAEEGMTALALIFQLARATSWESGPLRGGGDASRLADLLESWLTTWASASARDSLLAEPSMAALMLYARAMREARNAPLIGSDDAADARGRTFLERITGVAATARTSFGNALFERHPRAAAMLVSEKDCLRGLAEECSERYPDLDGSCHP